MEKNGATVLTILGSIGTVATAIEAASESAKLTKILEKKKEYMPDGKVPTKEIFKMAAPIYWPSVATGVATITCIIGSNKMNKKMQANLISAYTFLSSSYRQYREKVKEDYGSEADKRIKEEIAKDKSEKQDVYITPSSGFEEDEKIQEKALFYDSIIGRYFESTIFDVIMAEYHLNRNFALNGFCCLNEFYEFLGLDWTPYGDIVGWSYDYGYAFIDFNHKKITLDDGLECYYIDYTTPPEDNCFLSEEEIIRNCVN